MYFGAVGAIVMPGEAALQQVTAEARSLVVAWGCSAIQRARLQDAVYGTAQLREIQELGSLSFRSSDGFQAPDIVVLAVANDAARDVVTIARDIRVRCPRAALVAYCGGIRDTPASIAALAAAGVHQFVFTDVNDRGVVLRSILSSARHQCAAEVVLAALRPWVPAPIHSQVEAALARPAIVTDVRALADALGVHRKTLFNRCAHSSFLSPAELLTWTRLALVAYHLETTGVTIERIALETGYPSPTALRNTMKRYTGLRPSEIRVAGGLERVLNSLCARLWRLDSRLTPKEAPAPSGPLHAV